MIRDGGKVDQAGAAKGSTSLVSLPLQHGADFNKTDEDGCTPISIAAKYRRSDIVKLLLQHYIGIYEQQYYSGDVPLTPPLILIDEYAAKDDTLLDEALSEVVTRSRILCLLHVLFETWIVNLTDDDVVSMLVDMLILERMQYLLEGV